MLLRPSEARCQAHRTFYLLVRAADLFRGRPRDSSQSNKMARLYGGAEAPIKRTIANTSAGTRLC